jgi:hypothetical protein
MSVRGIILVKRAAKLVQIDHCITAFLKEFRQNSHTGGPLEGAFYWNEREVQWELFNHLRARTVSRSIGSRWWIHAEGSVERPKYARWERNRRADIVVMNHSKLRNWFKKKRPGLPPPYEAMIEVKMIWTGQGYSSTVKSIRKDAKKLAACLRDKKTKEAHIILLDALSNEGVPYYSSLQIEDLLASVHLRPRIAPRLHLWHWPDSEEPVWHLPEARWHHYTGYV